MKADELARPFSDEELEMRRIWVTGKPTWDKVERHYVESRYLKNIDALNKRVAELEIQNIQLRNGAQLGPIIGAETIANQQLRIAELEGALKDRPAINPDCQGCMRTDQHLSDALAGKGGE